MIRHRGDVRQPSTLEAGLETLLSDYAPNILPVDIEISQMWGMLRAPIQRKNWTS